MRYYDALIRDINELDKKFGTRDFTSNINKISSILFKGHNVSYYEKDTFKLFIKIAIAKYKMSLNKGGEKCK